MILKLIQILNRSSHPEVFLGKGVLKICCKFTGEHPFRNAILEHTWVAASERVIRLLPFSRYFLNRRKFAEMFLPSSRLGELKKFP